MNPRVKFLLLFALFNLCVQASAPEASGEEERAEESERNEEAVLDALRPILRSAGASARIDYQAVCRETNKEKAVWFPRVSVQRSSNRTFGLEGVRQLFTHDDRVLVTQGARGLIRIRIGSVSAALLQTKISMLKLNALQRYNPYDAVGALKSTSEFQSAVEKLRLYDLPVVIGGLVFEPEPDLPHLPSVMENVTIDQVLDAIAKTFGGIVVYGECVSPVDNTRCFVLTFEFARKLGERKKGRSTFLENRLKSQKG
jgi:hypothetical protein